MTHYAPPPRRIALSTRLQCLFGGFVTTFGWIFFGFGLIFTRTMAADLTPMELMRWKSELGLTHGEITGSEYSNGSENKITIQRVFFSYSVDGQPYSGVSYVTTEDTIETSGAPVEYTLSDPSHARIQGMRSTWFSSALMFAWLFPLVGLGPILFALFKGLKAIDLMRNGYIAEGRFVRRESTNVEINHKPLFKYIYTFEGPLGPQEVTARSVVDTHPTPEDTERIFYSPASPERAIVFDNISSRPVLMPDGSITARVPGQTLLVLIAPTIVIGIHLAWTLFF